MGKFLSSVVCTGSKFREMPKWKSRSRRARGASVKGSRWLCRCCHSPLRNPGARKPRGLGAGREPLQVTTTQAEGRTSLPCRFPDCTAAGPLPVSGLREVVRARPDDSHGVRFHTKVNVGASRIFSHIFFKISVANQLQQRKGYHDIKKEATRKPGSAQAQATCGWHVTADIH